MHSDDISSWAAIVATGSLLIQACSAQGTGQIGGWAYAGDEGYMRVTIMDSRYLRLANSGSAAYLGIDVA